MGKPALHRDRVVTRARLSLALIGTDASARKLLKILDDEMVRAGAPFDIVTTVTLEDAEGIGLTEVLMSANRQ